MPSGSSRRHSFQAGAIIFLAFNTSTAFSATDTMILSRQAKLRIMVQSLISLLTIALVVGRGVNIIAG